MAREPVKRIQGVSIIQPVAQPTNTYVRPVDPGPSPLREVAQGLSALDTGLGQFLAGRKAKQDDADKIRAEAAFNANNAMGWSEAVKQGKVPANASPIFMKSYKAAQGNLAGIQLREKFNGAYLNWDGKNSNDPNAFQGFISDFVKQNVQTDDPDVLRTLNEHVRTMFSEGYSHFGEESAKSVYNGALNTRAAISGRSIDAANDEGLGSGKGTNYDELWSQLMAQREEALHAGTRHEDYDKELAKTLAAKAMEHGDPMILSLLDKVLPGDSVKMSDLPDFRDLKADTISKLASANRQKMTDEDAIQKKLDTARERAIQDGVARALADDPNAEIPDDIMKEWARYDGEAQTKLVNMRKTLSEGKTFENPEDVAKLLMEIREGADKNVIYKAFQDGIIKDPGTLKDMLDRSDRFTKARQEGSGILTGQTSKRYLGMIKERTADKGQPLLPDFLGGAGAGLTNEGLQATQDFENMAMEWDEKNPTASMMEREKALNEIGETILSRIDQSASADDPKKYVGQADMDRQQAQEIMHPNGAPTPVPTTKEALQDPALDNILRPFKPGEFVDNHDGTISTERSETYQLPDGSWVNVPSLWMSREGPKDFAGDEDGIMENMRAYEDATGNKFPRFKTVEEAETAAEARSANGGAAAGTVTEKLYGGEEPPMLDLLPDDYQKYIEDNTPEGMTPQEFNMEIWKKAKAIVHGATGNGDAPAEGPKVPPAVDPMKTDSIQFDDAAAKQTSDAIGTMIDNMISSGGYSTEMTDSAVAPILKLIGYTEGTAERRGYNETLGYGAYTGGDKELTKMTLGQIKQLQSQMLAHPNNKWNSSALGQYQIVGKTLRKLQQEMGLSDDVLFDAKTQDAMAVQLLKGRGLDAWLSGKMTDKAFMDNLSKEWASLPTSGGKGYYSGQNARVGTSSVLSAFAAMRDANKTSPFDSILTNQKPTTPTATPAAYAKIPAKEVSQFVEWNSDPVANHESNLKTLKPQLADVIRKAQQIAKVKFVVGAGARTEELQKKAVQWGWSKTMDSDHLDHDGTGSKAVDLWPLDDNGAVDFEATKQAAIVAAMKQAAKELGVSLDVGADWKSFKDKPHFALKG